MHYSAIYKLFGQERGEGGRKQKWKGGFKGSLQSHSPFEGFYIAPEEETDKENIDISSFSRLTTNSYS